MPNNIQEKISSLSFELDYQARLKKHSKNLPPLEPGDRQILNTLKRDGIYITNLAELGFNSSSQMLSISDQILPTMGQANYNSASENHPEIYIVTDLPEFYNWGSEPRLLNIIENYIGLPVAYHGVHLRKDFPNENQFATLLWHRDIEDRRVLKVIVYLNDVDTEQGPFEYVPLAFTSLPKLNYYRIKYKIKNTGGIDDQTLNQIVPKSAWKSCTGKAGTVILADTRRLLHHGTLRTQERSTLFFAYTANPPKQPQLCTHFWDNSYPKPDFIRASAEVKVDDIPTLVK
ncbi:phytanoyl-CoA dioxygenase [Nostoc sp. TCL26-01]|uniref:phytanoyl-CoA dioxygenase n=1 Tax=Nostoc sp. TCL26-01 TaxID=2576904 RepID=UPI0015BE1D0D|nr:phytanoyl-CoA dioxygenase [Nostoc sp. TCL26-01]QLE56100.1 phytanoyl-CoA dioxygenase [Nostoc sp. TCL26-01]